MGKTYQRVSRHRRHGQGGFTLIELLVVIAVLAILATIVLFNVTGVKNKGQTAACQTDVGTVQTAVDADINDKGSFAATGLATGSMIGADLTTLHNQGYLHSSNTACDPATGGAGLSLTANGTTGGYDVTSP